MKKRVVDIINVLIICKDFPYKNENAFVFVKELVDQWVDSGYDCSVLAPQSVTKVLFRGTPLKPLVHKAKTQQGKAYDVHSTKYLTFSNIPILSRLNQFFFQRSVRKAYNQVNKHVDFIYAHFLFGPGQAARRIHNKYGVPFFIALGESRFPQAFFRNKTSIQKIFDEARGIISVSNEIKSRIVDAKYKLDTDKLLIKPNGVNFRKFYPMNKHDVRQKLNIKPDSFIVIFVGEFSQRKGAERLDNALKETFEDIKAIFIGKGPYQPTYDKIIYSGPVKHKNLPYYLNASDVFVLPTINEGSSNAILEAMACGLPIISADRDFNDDILTEDYSIKINPLNIKDIRDAIQKLYRNPIVTSNMANSAIASSSQFSLAKRAESIISFIKEKSIDCGS